MDLEECFKQSLKAFLVPPPEPGTPVYEQLHKAYFSGTRIALTPEIQAHLDSMGSTQALK